tara:strand:- start:4678 stop:5010 length:333 start_codon:yes stop_codon:yes gene_type:complete
MKDRIRKILRESDFDWTKENTNEVPIKEIEDWVDKTRYEVAGWIQKIDEFYKNAPQVDWSVRSDIEDEDKMLALTVKSVGDELRNIYDSFETIDGDIEYLRNPKMFDDFD